MTSDCVRVRHLPEHIKRVILVRTHDIYDILPDQRRGGSLRVTGPHNTPKHPITRLDHACKVKPIYKYKDVFK